MKFQIIVIGFLCTLAATLGLKARYDNYQIWSLKIDTDRQLKVLQNIEAHPDGYQLWGSPTHTGQFIEIVVPPHKLGEFEHNLMQFEFKNQLINPNLQNLIDNEQPKNYNASAKFGWDRYNTLDQIYEWLDDTIAKHSSVAKPLLMGHSWEGRPIKGIHINYKKNKKPTTIFIESNIHAREWITSATTTWLINKLLTSTDKDVRFMAEHFEWYIFPNVNPDGFVYSHTTDRMWRKTRSQHSPTQFCLGTDGNRNFNFSFMQGGASQDPCTETYAGPYAFSEKETTAIANFMETIVHKVELFLSFHSYSQLLMYPYGHTQTPINNQKDHAQVANAAAKALQQLFGTKYTVGNAQAVLYTTSGGSRDWAKGHHNIPFSFTYEMRDTGRYGFILPAEQIVPNAQEILTSLIHLVKEAIQLGYFPIEV